MVSARHIATPSTYTLHAGISFTILHCSSEVDPAATEMTSRWIKTNIIFGDHAQLPRLATEVMNDLASAALSRHVIIAYWVTTALVVFELALGGAWDVLRVPQVRGLIEQLGYPSYFLVILGTWKLLGAVALVIPRFPRLKEWAYAGAIFDLTGAVVSLIVSGLTDVRDLAYPIFMTGMAIASWSLRPSSRRLGS